ncbi:L-dopachrome tautomerase-related protein [Hymenobacter coalescens]
MSFIFLRSSLIAGSAVIILGSCNADKGNASTDGTPADSSAAATQMPTAPANSPLQLVGELREPQFVGVAVLPDNRVLLVSPRWDYNPVNPIAILGPGNSVKPYPDAGWCTWNDSVRNEPEKHWICPQAATVDKSGMLWVLDPAAPGLKYTVPGGPKLVKIDPKTNQVVQTIRFDQTVAPRKSYLNDVRIDLDNNYAYITESSQGGLVVVDLKTQKARRVLTNHPSVKAEDIRLNVEGNPMLDPTDKPAKLHSDGIALSRDNQHLYYHAVTGYTLYRIPTAALRNPGLSEAQLGQQVENLGKTPAADGLEIDAAGNVYITAIEQNAVVRRTPDGKMEELAKDPRLQWPDTYFLTPDNTLYVTASAIHKTPTWNKGVGKQNQPYRLFKMKLPQ